MLELLGDLFDWVVGIIQDPPEIPIPEPETILDVVSTAFLIQGVIYVASLTVDSIRSELSNRRELKDKGVQHVQVLQEFINQSGYTEISLAALNAQNKQVGTVRMQTKGYTNVKKGDRIRI